MVLQSIVFGLTLERSPCPGLCLKSLWFMFCTSDFRFCFLQALIATSVSKGDYRDVKEITYFVLKVCPTCMFEIRLHFEEDEFNMKLLLQRFSTLIIHLISFRSCYLSFQIGLLTGVCLAAVLGISFSSLATLFTKDAEVLGIVRTGVLVCGNSHVIAIF